ncbi:MAG: 2-succinyl-5-enolpyruvyl-6-hydroxy-3-cyclohexene-1-carboxylic-acid synthase [Opitutaceae bacterium]|nr:2-succinyl-5-enolpyruvyl-6-hydroxy-3-cyclohexene-1-carboxylic-acid synthase [Opitutaceae bacterium]
MSTASFIDLRNVNSLWASVLVETLVRAGVRHAVISPGSRSTPLTLAFAANPGIEAVPVLDERSAGFFALGLARHDMRPVALVCTSGTAAANFYPAIVEAHESAIPLLVLTADRPPELRASASGQTIDQQKLYGGYVEFYHELALPEPNEPLLRYLRQTVAHALVRSHAGGGAPVHLNVPFRDPLAPLADGGAAANLANAVDWELFFRHVAPPAPTRMLSPLPPIVPDVHGAIVVGPNQPANVDEFVASIGEISRRLGWPVLADGLSPVRNHAAGIAHVVSTYDLILRNGTAAERLKPEVVLCIGGWPTSKVLRAWLENSMALVWLVTERRDNRDSLHGRTVPLMTSLPALAGALPVAQDPGGYERMWSRYEQKARVALDERLRNESGLFEPKAAWLLAQQLPPQTPLIVANSMPVRDLEHVWPPGNRGIRPWCNRGANGIDGTLSSALGVAHVAGRPAVLLSGDLALLHDSNGFLIRPKFGGSLTIVLINNRGGGIFEHLPIAEFEPPFEEFFATPQEADFEKVCATYEVGYELVADWTQFTRLISTLPDRGIRVLEMRTDRKRDAAMRKQVFAEIAASLG